MASPGYGPLESITRISVPLPEPGRGEVRVKVHTSAINPADFKVVLGSMKFLHARNKPLIVGYDFSGTIVAVGAGVKDDAVGDEVFGFLPYSPMNRRGAFAEFLIARSSDLAIKPSPVTHAQASAVATSGVSALQAMRDLGGLRSGHRVLITGASGGVGLLAVSIARRLGASVTAVGSGRGLELARLHGAEAVIDRKAGSVLNALKGPYDVIFDPATAYRWRTMKPYLKPGGAFVTTLPSVAFFIDKLASLFSSTRVGFLNVKARPADLNQLAEWMMSGMQVTVDHTIPVRDVAKSMAKLKNGGVVGRIVVDVKDSF
ncbi:MAG: NAD(P)-dependent alcohol dehydrogenase [Flavobacteriales bacterium]